ncbi:MAG: alpha-amylase/4-alpha-glucanotransferase domain-containing protein [Candidatus Cryosericum sp.]
MSCSTGRCDTKRLCLCIHNHQPVGNFDHVFRDAIARSYLPFLETLARYPHIKVSLHTSGPLLEFIERDGASRYMELVRALVDSGQVELVGGGYFEPVLQLLPERDRIEQIQLMSDELFRLFGRRPTGLWLTERVWEPCLASSLARAGVHWTLIDDNGFEKIGLKGQDLTHAYVTEDQGQTLTVFPILKELRYRIPWAEPEETLHIIRESGDDAEVFVYGDDGEKFGLWPGTYDHVYTNGWLERFFQALTEASDVATATVSEAAALQPRERVYLPACSYIEMEEWSLAAARQRAYETVRNSVTPENRAFVSGGTFRNYLARYYEANRLHKRMLFVGSELAGDDGEARMHYLRSQCNCAYWHGIFGGLYLPHLRDAVYHELLTAERLSPARHLGAWLQDVDADGLPEAVVTTPHQTMFIHQSGGQLVQWDDLDHAWSWSNVMTRYHEAYHDRMLESAPAYQTDGVANIHESLLVKDPEALGLLTFDDHTRVSFIDRFGPSQETTINAPPYARKYALSISESSAQCDAPGAVTKTFAPTDHGLRVQIDITSPEPWYVCELNVAAWWEDREKVFDATTFSVGTAEHHLLFEVSSSAHVELRPIRTVSNSESGIETIYQGMTVLLAFNTETSRHLVIDIGG